MSLSTYSDLVSAVGDILDRDDLASRVPTFIQLTEARLNRMLDDPKMEVTVETDAESSTTALPSDFGSMVAITTGNGPLSPIGQSDFGAYDLTISGTPRYYVISEGYISFWPVNTTTPILMVYRRRLPPLTALNPTNWLLSLAPDAYFHGVLAEACLWDHDEDRAAIHNARVDEIIGELRVDADKRRWGSGSIYPKVRRA